MFLPIIRVKRHQNIAGISQRRQSSRMSVDIIPPHLTGIDLALQNQLPIWELTADSIPVAGSQFNLPAQLSVLIIRQQGKSSIINARERK